MRINQFVAQATGLSRRATDLAIIDGRVKVNDKSAVIGQIINDTDKVLVDNKLISLPISKTTILINKPIGYVCSRDGQGSKTIYELVPEQYRRLKHVGRLDKDSSGLVILTDDGDLAHKLSHPSFDTLKIYTIELDISLKSDDKDSIEEGKVELDERPSPMKINSLSSNNKIFEIELHEGRNRQIRRTFAALGYDVMKLRRDQIGQFKLPQLDNRSYLLVNR